VQSTFPKKVRASYETAKRKSTEGWCGIPQSAFRCAIIQAGRTTGLKLKTMTSSVWVEADGFDVDDASPLVRITKGKPNRCEHRITLPSDKCCVRVHAMWGPGWEAKVRVKFDADQFSLQDVSGLVTRAGMQIGIGEGRPDNRASCGMGWGLFELKGGKK
jgi:hypothetical protein